jgi:hypothetical protein
MRRRKDEARGARGWTRLLAGSGLAVILALPSAASAEPASDGTGAAGVGAPIQNGAGPAQENPLPGGSPATGTDVCKQEPTSGRSNCENDYAQTCFQPGGTRAARPGQASYAQSHFQPGAEPGR